MEKKAEGFCRLGAINRPGYTTAKLKTVSIASFVKTSTIITCIMTLKHRPLKHARITDKGFHPQKSSNCHQKAIQRLLKIPKSMGDISEMVKSNLTEVQSQNRAYLIKIISYLSYLTRKGLPLREHENDQDSNFKQLFFLPFPCISESCVEIKIKLNIYFHTSLRCLKRIYEGLHKTF